MVGNAMDVGISDKVVPANVQDSSYSPLVHFSNPLYIYSRMCCRLVELIFSNFNHHRVLERKNKQKQYTINTKILSICKIIKRM